MRGRNREELVDFFPVVPRSVHVLMQQSWRRVRFTYVGKSAFAVCQRTLHVLAQRPAHPDSGMQELVASHEDALAVAEQRGLRITERKGNYDGIYKDLIRVTLQTSTGQTSISATVAHDGPHLVEINDFWVDVSPGEGYLLLVENLLDLSHLPYVHANSLGSPEDINPVLQWERGENFVRGTRIAKNISPGRTMRDRGMPDFTGKLQDILKQGVGNLVDADLAMESAALQALQIKQQLGVQALAIANAGPQSVLALFRP